MLLLVLEPSSSPNKTESLTGVLCLVFLLNWNSNFYRLVIILLDYFSFYYWMRSSISDRVWSSLYILLQLVFSWTGTENLANLVRNLLFLQPNAKAQLGLDLAWNHIINKRKICDCVGARILKFQCAYKGTLNMKYFGIHDKTWIES